MNPMMNQNFMGGAMTGPAQMTGNRAPFTPRGMTPRGGAMANAGSMVVGNPSKKAHATLGVIRLDYDYPPAPGDIDCPQSFSYDVFYRVVPGLTFAMCQSGKLSADVRMEFIEAI